MKKKKKEVKVYLYIIFFSIVIIASVYFTIIPTFLGYTILQGYKIDITNVSNFNYNASEIEIANGIISLKQIVTSTNYTQEKKFTTYVESATRYLPDETVNATEEVSALDGNITNADKNNVFDVTFNETLENNDVLNFYLKGINNGSQTEIYLCQLSTQCASPGYGRASYNGSEGWFFITIENLSSQIQGFNIDPPVKVKFDYINATKIISEEYSETNISYPSSSIITTADTVVQDIVSWNNLEVEETLNDQNITYEYSEDSGESWQPVPEDKNLSAVNSTKIRIKAILSSNTTATPSISSINITYLTKEPQTYFEVNNSETISTIKDENITVNSTSSNLELNIVTTESLSNIDFNVTELKDTRPSNISRLKEIEIISPELQNKISTATIKVYYTDEEVENLNESTLKLYYYNETSESWQELDSTVNTEENYLQASLQHFSIYGIFGESTQQENTESQSSANSGGSESGGSGGKREFTRGTSVTQQQQPQQSEQPQQTQTETGEAAESPQENTEQEIIQTETQASNQLTFTGNIVRIGKVLTEGKVNRSLWILLAILIVAYIITRIEEKGKFFSRK